jgi:hypothetical protein
MESLRLREAIETISNEPQRREDAKTLPKEASHDECLCFFAPLRFINRETSFRWNT